MFDGELIAFSADKPDFVRALRPDAAPTERSVPIAFVAFEGLSLEGTNTMREPYTKRRELLENLELAGPHWSFTPSFADREALWAVVEQKELEGGCRGGERAGDVSASAPSETAVETATERRIDVLLARSTSPLGVSGKGGVVKRSRQRVPRLQRSRRSGFPARRARSSVSGSREQHA